MSRRAYIAIYFPSGHEQVLKTDTHWSPDLSAYFDRLINKADRLPRGHYIQGWYSDAYTVECMGLIESVRAA